MKTVAKQRYLVVALLAALLASPVAAQVIAGGVVNRLSGEPVAQVRLRLHGNTDRFAVTDSGGRFEFAGLPPDRYSLLGDRAGFVSEIRVVALAAGAAVRDLRFPLTPQAAVSGMLVDADGWPVPEAFVRVLRAGAGPDPASAGSGYSDDLGRFRVGKLPPGRYYLSVNSPQLRGWDERYRETSYPLAGAAGDQALALSAGQELDGLAIRMANPEGVTVRGRVAIPPGTLPAGQSAPVLSLAEPFGGQYVCSSCQADGTFVFRHVLPGSYWLRLSPPSGEQPDWAYWSAAVMKLEVGRVDLSGIELTLLPNDPHELRGSVVSGDPSLPAPPGIALTRLDLPRAQAVNRVAPGADGAFLMARTPAGRYRIDVIPASLQAPPVGVMVRLGDTELPGGEFAFDGTATPLRVELVPAIASLSVQVFDAGGRGAWDAVVHIEPVNPALRVKAGGATNQNGNFEGLLPPGEYRVWAEAEGAGAAPARTVRLAAGVNGPLRLELAGRLAF